MVTSAESAGIDGIIITTIITLRMKGERTHHLYVWKAQVWQLWTQIPKDRRIDAASTDNAWAEPVRMQPMQRELWRNGTDARSRQEVSFVPPQKKRFWKRKKELDSFKLLYYRRSRFSKYPKAAYTFYLRQPRKLFDCYSRPTTHAFIWNWDISTWRFQLWCLSPFLYAQALHFKLYPP